MEEIEKIKNKGVLRDFWDFLWAKKLWWMIPIIIVLVIVASLLVLMQSNYISPFIYAL